MDIAILFLIGFVGHLIKQGVVTAFTAETEIGYCEGDVCGRNGCCGIIESRPPRTTARVTFLRRVVLALRQGNIAMSVIGMRNTTTTNKKVETMNDCEIARVVER